MPAEATAAPVPTNPSEPAVAAARPSEAAGPAPSEPEPPSLPALAEAAARRLLVRGRVREAAPLLARLGRAAPPVEPQADEPSSTAAPVVEAALAEAGPEARTEWDRVGYENWVVPPGCGRRPLASLDAEWVCRADRWRVLEELRRVDDPAEHERVLGHFVRAGLDPGLDHPAFAGLVEVVPRPPDPAPPPPVDPLLAWLGEEAEASHGAARRRHEAEAWRRHARELGVPVPPHADPLEDLDPADPEAALPATAVPNEPEPAGEPRPSGPGGHGRPPEPRTGALLPDPPGPPPEPALSWPAEAGPRPVEPEPPWPWPADEGTPPSRAAERSARAPRPAPAGKTSRPVGPDSAAARAAAAPAGPPPPDPPPVVWAQEPLTPHRLARLRGDYPWWQ